MKDRFDLETEISELYNFVEHLNTLGSGLLQNNISEDEVVNAIIGVAVLLKLQADKLNDTMSQCFKLDRYNKKDLVETEDYL